MARTLTNTEDIERENFAHSVKNDKACTNCHVHYNEIEGWYGEHVRDEERLEGLCNMCDPTSADYFQEHAEYKRTAKCLSSYCPLTVKRI